MVLAYNAGYRLSLTSSHLGRLKRTGSNAYIPYSLTVNSQTLDLSTGTATLPDVLGVSPAAGVRLPVQVTIGSISGAAPGTYSETVTLTVTSTE